MERPLIDGARCFFVELDRAEGEVRRRSPPRAGTRVGEQELRPGPSRPAAQDIGDVRRRPGLVRPVVRRTEREVGQDEGAFVERRLRRFGRSAARGTRDRQRPLPNKWSSVAARRA